MQRKPAVVIEILEGFLDTFSKDDTVILQVNKIRALNRIVATEGKTLSPERLINILKTISPALGEKLVHALPKEFYAAIDAKTLTTIFNTTQPSDAIRDILLEKSLAHSPAKNFFNLEKPKQFSAFLAEIPQASITILMATLQTNCNFPPLARLVKTPEQLFILYRASAVGDGFMLLQEVEYTVIAKMISTVDKYIALKTKLNATQTTLLLTWAVSTKFINQWDVEDREKIPELADIASEPEFFPHHLLPILRTSSDAEKTAAVECVEQDSRCIDAVVCQGTIISILAELRHLPIARTWLAYVKKYLTPEEIYSAVLDNLKTFSDESKEKILEFLLSPDDDRSFLHGLFPNTICFLNIVSKFPENQMQKFAAWVKQYGIPADLLPELNNKLQDKSLSTREKQQLTNFMALTEELTAPERLPSSTMLISKTLNRVKSARPAETIIAIPKENMPDCPQRIFPREYLARIMSKWLPEFKPLEKRPVEVTLTVHSTAKL